MYLEDKIKGALVFIGFFLMVVFVGFSENHYTRTATYYGDGKFIDYCGYVWIYDGDFEIGKDYELSMFTNGTDSIIHDDKVLKVR